MNEIFREIAGYEGLYEVSNLGVVRSLNYNRTGQVRVLKPGKDTGGYLYVALSKDSKMKNHRVHRLVATAFIPNIENLPEVNHIDENKANNVVSNLEWCSHAYNMIHGTLYERSAKAQSKKVLQFTLDYVFVKEWVSTKECGRNGFNSSAVATCCRNKYGLRKNVYKGFRWIYAEDYYKMFT